MTTEIQNRLLELAQMPEPPKSFDVAASFMRKLAAKGDPMDKFAKLNNHLAKLKPAQRDRLMEAVDELLVNPSADDGEPTESVAKESVDQAAEG